MYLFLFLLWMCFANCNCSSSDDEVPSNKSDPKSKRVDSVHLDDEGHAQVPMPDDTGTNTQVTDRAREEEDEEDKSIIGSVGTQRTAAGRSMVSSKSTRGKHKNELITMPCPHRSEELGMLWECMEKQVKRYKIGKVANSHDQLLSQLTLSIYTSNLHMHSDQREYINN